MALKSTRLEAIAIRLEAIATRWEAIAITLEAIATRLEAIAIRLEAIATRWEAIAIRLEAIATRLEAIAIRLEAIVTSNNVMPGSCRHGEGEQAGNPRWKPEETRGQLAARIWQNWLSIVAFFFGSMKPNSNPARDSH